MSIIELTLFISRRKKKLNYILTCSRVAPDCPYPSAMPASSRQDPSIRIRQDPAAYGTSSLTRAFRTPGNDPARPSLLTHPPNAGPCSPKTVSSVTVFFTSALRIISLFFTFMIQRLLVSAFGHLHHPHYPLSIPAP